MPSNLGKSSKGGKIDALEGKRLFLGIFSALLKKAPMLQYFSRQNTVPDGGGNTDKQKRRYLGFRGSIGKGWRAGGSEPLSSLLGKGVSLYRWKKWLPLGAVPRRRRLATLAVRNPRPSQFLRTPKRGRTAVPLRLLPAAHAQLFVCCWSFSLLRKKRNRQEDGAEEGEAPGKKRCTFAAVDGGREGLLFAEAAKPGAS